MAINRFRNGGCFTCEKCGKRTRETGEQPFGIRQCKACILHGEALNAHNDNKHAANPVHGCPICEGAK